MPVRRSPQRRLLYLTAAAALGSSLSSPCCFAFSPFQPFHHVSSLQQHSLPFLHKSPSQHHLITTSTRLYSSNNNSNNGGFLGKLKGAAKKVLPFLKTDQEKQAALERKRVKQEVKGGIQEILKDAPLPIKLVGSMIAPLLGSAMSTISQQMSEQQRQLDELLEDARVLLVRDVTASQALGEPITVGTPFQQGSSTIMMNGKTSTQIQAAFNVMGSNASGVARMDATQDGISSLLLDVNGRRINVNLSGRSGSTVVGGGTSSSFSKTRLGKNTKNTGDIIDVEFVEKKDDNSK